jgi:hypothetical protein
VTVQDRRIAAKCLLYATLAPVQPAFAQLRIHEVPNESSHMLNRPEGMSLGGTVTLPSRESAVNNFSSSLFELQSMNTEKLLP